MTGFFITLEGGEGAGKTTQIERLKHAFEKTGLPLYSTREPGGTVGAESIRELLVTGEADKWDPMSETILFTAARIDHVRKVILPHLREGTHVLCDRFMDSTAVYQGLVKGLGLPFIEMLHHFTLGNLAPDLTLLLDIPAEEGLRRAHSRDDHENRFEKMDSDFHTQVRDGFLNLAKRHPSRYAVIDATQSVDEVEQAIAKSLKERLGLVL